MNTIFTKVLELSMVGTYSILLVLTARWFLSKVSRKYCYILWAVVFINLVLPFSFAWKFSLIPEQLADKVQLMASADANTLASQGIQPVQIPDREKYQGQQEVQNQGEEYNQANGQIQQGQSGDQPDLTNGSTAVGTDITSGTNRDSLNPLIYLSFVWAIGAAIILGMKIIHLIRFGAQIRGSKLSGAGDGVYICGKINSPFLWGTKIYLPETLSSREAEYVLAHECCHIRRKDYITKPAALLIACIHWFNPLVWIAYRLFVNDMEMSCDEMVLSRNGSVQKKEYAAALLSVAARQSGFAFLPPAFGETGVKSRIKHVLGYTKRSTRTAAAAVIVVVIITAGLLVRPAAAGMNPIAYDNSFIQDNKIYLINEAGDGWNNITPQDIPENDMILNALFINRNSGWAVSADANESDHFTFYRTQNGGQAWETSTVDEAVFGEIDMDFVDENSGWLLVHQGAGMNKELVSVMRTEDGGAAWETVSKTDYPGMIKDGFISGPMDKTGISFLNENAGWVTGCEINPGIVFLYSTKDGGKTWNADDIKLPEAYKDSYFISLPPHFFTDKAGILPLSYEKGMLFYSTSDGGSNWTLASGIVTPDMYYSLYSFCGNKYCFFTDGTSMFTTLLGKSKWNKTSLNQSVIKNMPAAKMIFTDKETGWIVGGYGNEYILKTTDQGKHWEKTTDYLADNH